jgi:TetR/AcrR family macrolide resistance operon transcriptional repressor
MARPKQASDEDIIQSAQRIYTQRGHAGFTLSELSRDVGLSRAAIIQRFDNAETLRMRLARERVALFEQTLKALPHARGGDDLIALAAFIGSMVGGQRQFAVFMQNLEIDLEDGELRELEIARGEALLEAIAARMPTVAITRRSAALAFRAHISGSLMQWQVETRPISTEDFLIERTREWLKLAGIAYSRSVHRYPAWRE